MFQECRWKPEAGCTSFVLAFSSKRMFLAAFRGFLGVGPLFFTLGGETRPQRPRLAVHQGALAQCWAAATEGGSPLPKELQGCLWSREQREWMLPHD